LIGVIARLFFCLCLAMKRQSLCSISP